MDLTELVLWLLSLILSSVISFFLGYYFYKRQKKEGEANNQILKRIDEKNDAEIRLGNDKRGKLIKNSDGTIGIAWQQTIVETLTVTDEASGQKKQ